MHVICPTPELAQSLGSIDALRLSLSTGAAYCYPLSLTFELARAAGFQSVELVIGPEAVWRKPHGVASLARRYGLTISSIHGPILPQPGWPAGAPRIDLLVRYASALDPAPLVVLHVPRSSDMTTDPRGVAYRRALGDWREACERQAVPLAIETPGLFVARDRDLALFDVEELSAFAEQEGAGLVLDTVHVASLGYDLLDAYPLMRGRLMNVHFSDLRQVSRWLDRPFLHSYVKHHQLPGHGILPLEPFLRALVRDGYDGLLTLELSPVAVGLWSPQRVMRSLQASLRFVQRIISEPDARVTLPGETAEQLVAQELALDAFEHGHT